MSLKLFIVQIEATDSGSYTCIGAASGIGLTQQVELMIYSKLYP